MVTAFLFFVALVGPDEATSDLAPWVPYITSWVGLVPVSLVRGPVWRVVNPLRLLHRLLAHLSGPVPAAHRLPALGLWPAVTRRRRRRRLGTGGAAQSATTSPAAATAR